MALIDVTVRRNKGNVRYIVSSSSEAFSVGIGYSSVGESPIALDAPISKDPKAFSVGVGDTESPTPTNSISPNCSITGINSNSAKRVKVM